ncbi:hypothetical protein ACJRO7_002601 [Eucalyptus globulus]|uniref:Uncharacterized protein n=1 Tax=Eucalyptus globulus TaxID=34317 RepID=A0ABD3LY93_EUCGL
MGENGGAVHLERKLRLRLEPSPPPPTALRRRNSIATSTAVVPAAAKPPAQSLSFPNGTAAAHPPLPPPLDLSGHAFPSYTSLRDLLPPSPTASSAAAAAAACSSYEISIRNRLVNQAAWAYLRPTSASPGSDGPHLLRRLWLRLSACLGFVCRALGRIARFFLPVRSGR